MAPFIVLSLVFITLLIAGRVGVPWLSDWRRALRCALSAMFLLTGWAHFGSLRPDLVAMVPPALPMPGLLVTVTGVAELLGALALLWPRTAPWAAWGLAALLLAMFPANVHAAQAHLSIGGRPVMGVAARGALQLVFLAAAVAATGWRPGRATPSRSRGVDRTA